MTIRRCYRLVDLVSFLSFYIFSQKSHLPKEPHHLHHFTILSQQCPYVTLDIVFLFAVSLWFLHAPFPHIGCWWSLDIKISWVNLVCHPGYCVSIMVNKQHDKQYSIFLIKFLGQSRPIIVSFKQFYEMEKNVSYFSE